MTDAELDALCKKLRNHVPDVYEWEQAADVIDGLRVRLAAAEADNAALRHERDALQGELDRIKASDGWATFATALNAATTTIYASIT